MPAGAKPGERRGGRAKGAKNKLTVEKELVALMPLSSHTLTGYASRLAKDVLAEAMGNMLMLAQKYVNDEEKFVHYWRMAQSFAHDLAPFQSPRLQTLKVGNDRDNPLLVRDGEAAAEIRASLEEMMRESGLVPTKLIEGVARRVDP